MKTFTVFHGTGCDRLASLLGSGPVLLRRLYLPRQRRAFSTTTDFEVGALFALRHSPPSLLSGDESGAGVVVEYRVAPGAVEGRDWMRAKDRGCLQDESEIAILKPGILTVAAVWRLRNGEWVRDARRRAV